MSSVSSDIKGHCPPFSLHSLSNLSAFSPVYTSNCLKQYAIQFGMLAFWKLFKDVSSVLILLNQQIDKYSIHNGTYNNFLNLGLETGENT
jgi:hypothetical protein